MNFDWQTEEYDWDGPISTDPEPPPSRHSRWGIVGLVTVVIVALSIGGLVIYRQANNRVEEVGARLEEDILASHRLVHLAAVEKDYELFVQVLSGRDTEWVAAQRVLLQRGKLNDRSGLGMYYIPPDNEPRVTRLIISPDLTSAQLQTAESYAIAIGNGLTDTVVLTQSVIYRQGPDNWLYSPPIEDPWGGWAVHEGRYLTLIYPESEAEIASRLAYDLETKLAELCAQVAGINCPSSFHISVRLSKEPESLLIEAELPAIQEHFAADEILLPAPRLVGMPVDEDGYRALRRGYAYHVIGAALLDLVDYECCGQSAFMQAMLEQVLADLALNPRPLHPAIYNEIFQSGLDITEPYISWNASTNAPGRREVREAAAVISFIRHQNTEASLPELARMMAQASSYWDWLRRFVPRLQTDDDIQRAWLDFILARSTVSGQELPYPLPDRDVVALCGLSSRSITGHLYRYRLDDGSWRAVETDQVFTNLFPAPIGEAVTLVFADNRVLTEPEMAVYSWDDDRPVLRWRPAENADLLYLNSVQEPAGQNLLISARSIGEGESGLYSFSPTACAAGDCSPQVFHNLPLHSPDGAHVLILQPTSPDISRPFVYLADKRGDKIADIGTGRLPFWIDSERFGFVRWGENDIQEIAFGTIDGGEPETIITLSDFMSILPENTLILDGVDDFEEGRTPVEINIGNVLVNPAQSHELFAILELGNGQQDQIFFYDLRSDQLQWLFGAGGVATGPLEMSFSPNGSWLMVSTFDMATNNGNVYLHSVNSGETESYPLHDQPYGLAWTDDSLWLAKVDGDWLVLIAPGTGYQQVTIHDLPKCGPAGWVRK